VIVQYKFLWPFPADENFAYVRLRFIKNFAEILKDASQAWFSMIKTAHFLHSATCAKTILETDNSSIWF